jgi:hypothetical protein
MALVVCGVGAPSYSRSYHECLISRPYFSLRIRFCSNSTWAHYTGPKAVHLSYLEGVKNSKANESVKPHRIVLVLSGSP